MNLANKLTIFRIVLAFVFIFFLYGGLTFQIIAFIIFIVASFTDFLDGWIARKRGQVTDFGKLMDPIADKVLVLGAFAVFVEMKIVPGWMFVLILSRELLVTGIRVFAVTKGVVLAAGKGGKHKTVSQLFAIFLILIHLIIRDILIKLGKWNINKDVDSFWVIFPILLVATALTLISGISYIYENRSVLKELK